MTSKPKQPLKLRITESELKLLESLLATEAENPNSSATLLAWNASRRAAMERIHNIVVIK